MLALGACTTVTDLQSRKDHEALGQRTDQANRQLRQPIEPAASVVEETLPRFARHSIPFDRTRMLPAHLGMVSLHLPGKYNIRSVAMHIERLTRIPVILAPDVLLPITDFAPTQLAARMSRSTGPKTEPVAGQETLEEITRQAAEGVTRAGAPRQWESDPTEAGLFELNHQGTLAGLLDRVAAQGQLQWSYESGQIRFFRVVSRTLTVKALPGSLSRSGSLTLAAGMGTMSSSVSSELNFWEGIEKTIKEMISPLGKISIDPALGYVVVTDALRNVEVVQGFVETLNRQLGRQVSLTVEVLQISLNAANQAGIDWSFVARSARWGDVGFISAPSLADNTGTISLVRPAANGQDNSLFIRALERFGRVSTAYSSVITTMNRQSVPLGSVSTQSYLRQVAPTALVNAAGATSYGPPALTPGEVTTGFTMSLLPIVLDSNRVILQCAVSISSLKELVTFTSGTGTAQQSIQQPNVASFATQQNMTVRSGDTIVLSGFESESTQSRESDIVRQVLPGSRSNARDKTTLVVLITPRILEY